MASNAWQQKNFEANIPKGELLQSGIDVSLVTQSDADYIKSSYRIFCFKYFDSRAYLINQTSGGAKFLYDLAAGITMWLYRVADEKFTEKISKISDEFKKAIEDKELGPDKYLDLANKLIIEAFDLECRLGWAPISQTKIAVLLNDEHSAERIDAAMQQIKISDEADQKAFVEGMLLHPDIITPKEKKAEPLKPEHSIDPRLINEVKI